MSKYLKKLHVMQNILLKSVKNIAHNPDQRYLVIIPSSHLRIMSMSWATAIA